VDILHKRSGEVNYLADESGFGGHSSRKYFYQLHLELT
jgi:hypothetical protein